MDNVCLKLGQKCAKKANTGNAYTGNSLKNARKMDNVCLKPGQKCAKMRSFSTNLTRVKNDKWAKKDLKICKLVKDALKYQIGILVKLISECADNQ